MRSYKQKLTRAVDYIQKRIKIPIKVGIILGSGLGRVSEEIGEKIIINYRDIPGFPGPTVQGHKGELVAGRLGEKMIIVFNGRFHYYQGFSLQDVTLPVRVAKQMGVENLIITNASGGINSDFKPGDIMLISDHINYMGVNPLVGEDPLAFGPIFVDLSEPYDTGLMEKTKKIAHQNSSIGELKEGVYLATSGPSYETKAEISFFKKIGADAVGMSTVPEVIVAAQEGLTVLGISVITNMACGIALGALTHEEVLETMSKTSERMILLLKEVMRNI